jgi:hypothetical protein
MALERAMLADATKEAPMFSKSKALKNTAIWTALALVLFMCHVAIVPWSFLLLAALIAIIWLCLYARDQKLIADAKAAQDRQPEQLTMPPMTNKGSNQLFVPPPLDRQ